MKQKVAIGLSGGVDSSVAAALLLEQGYEVTGVYLTCWSGPGCRSEEDRQDALDVALQLGIPFEHLDFQQAYTDRVYEYMIQEYEAGRTPNPDVMCNREIKFGLFYDWAIKQGYDYVATGHYAQTNGRQLLQSVDAHKDQTYFLYQLEQEQLQHILFPIGHMTKQQVREEAEKRELLTAKKEDSTGICFIGEVPMGKFLEKRIKPREGDIRLQTSDSSVGTHKGVWFYTIGQRIALDQRMVQGYDLTNLPHFYVVDKDVEENILYVGTDDQLYRDTLEIGDIHWITKSERDMDLSVRIRHTGGLHAVSDIKYQISGAQVTLEKPVRAVAAGQSAVLYQGNVCLGGGLLV